MNNEITIDIEAIKLSADNSITDPETIRQIALWGMKNRDSSSEVYRKIKKEFQVYGLYPEIMTSFSFYDESIGYKITEDGKCHVRTMEEALNKLIELRKEHKNGK